MRRSFQIKVSLLALTLATILPSVAHAETYTIDASHSAVLFKAKHFSASYTYGRFRGISGRIELAKKNSTVSIEIDAASIYTAHRKRDVHLKGPDFLNVKQYPKIIFRSTKVIQRGETFIVEGTLTLHGVKKAIKVNMIRTGTGVNRMSGKKLVGFEGSFSIDRVAYGMSKFIGAVGKTITLTVAIEATR